MNMDDAVIHVAQALAQALKATAGCVEWRPGSRWEKNLHSKTEILAKCVLVLMDESKDVRIGTTGYMREGECLMARSASFSFDMTEIGKNADKHFAKDFLLRFLEDTPVLLSELGYWERLSGHELALEGS